VSARRYVTLLERDSGNVTTHAVGGYADYATICGCSSNDDLMSEIPTPRGQRIDCRVCLEMYETARRFRPQDFATKGSAP
jgi:hypothetical protein